MEIQIPEVKVLQQISPEQAWHYMIFPKEIADEFIVFYAVSDDCKDELEILFGKKIDLLLTDEQELNKLLSVHYRRERTKATSQLNFQNESKDFIVKLISEAKNVGSSDIHLEVYDQNCRIRIRIDGKLIERYTLSKQDYPAIINKLKIMANLDIAEKRLPQDGRIFFNHFENKFDMRVSILPTLHGEKVVLRILSNDATNIDIQQLGFEDTELKRYLEGVKKSNGIILISGPTGSGKTTTLYATLKILNDVSRNITTIEDPIEYTLEGINQVQLKENIGLDFASAMRTFLRQDPDVIMVGEIRDPDTANMAIRASLTGHLVLSTIHTNSAWGTISRLVDMGIPSYLVANTLHLSVAQRLVRRLCPHCKKEECFEASLFPLTFQSDLQIEKHFVAEGCDDCYFTGYRGRKALYEVIPIDLELSEQIKKENFNVSELLREKGIKTIADNALSLFCEGETSLEEIYSLLMN